MLVLWDRIVGFDTTEVVALLAAAIFSFRAEALLRATTTAQIHAAFEDSSHLKVVPLLQWFLFMR